MNIYLTAPKNRHISPFVRQRRLEMVNCKAAELIKNGHIVFSPMSYSQPIVLQYDLSTAIAWCDSVYVYRLAGWQGSTGVQSEIEYAEKTGKPVIYIDQFLFIRHTPFCCFAGATGDGTLDVVQ